MAVIAILVLLVAALHLYFAWLEMIAWEAPRTRAIFGTDADFAAASKVLAANQGLYNLFLAVGLTWALAAGALGTLMLFLGFIVIAGLFGGLTASRRIIYVQALPAALALLAVLFF